MTLFEICTSNYSQKDKKIKRSLITLVTLSTFIRDYAQHSWCYKVDNRSTFCGLEVTNMMLQIQIVDVTF